MALVCATIRVEEETQPNHPTTEHTMNNRTASRHIGVILYEINITYGLSLTAGYVGNCGPGFDDRSHRVFKTGADGYAASWGGDDTAHDLYWRILAHRDRLVDWALDKSVKGSVYL